MFPNIPLSDDDLFGIVSQHSKEEWFQFCLAAQPDVTREDFDRSWDQFQIYMRIRITPTSSSVH